MRAAEIRAEAIERNRVLFGGDDRPGGVLTNWEGTEVVEQLAADHASIDLAPVPIDVPAARDEPDDDLFDYPEWNG